MPDWVQQVSSLVPKHPAGDTFKDIFYISILAYSYNFLLDLKNPNFLEEAFCEAVAKTSTRRLKETLVDRGVKKARKYLNINGMIAVPYKKDVGFCVMRKDTYENKQTNILDSVQQKGVI